MTYDAAFDLFFRVILILFVAVHGGVAIRALHRQCWTHAGRAHARAEAPLAFWREIGLACLRILLALAALLLMPRPVAGEGDPPYGPAFFLILLVPGMIRALWTGEIEFGSNRWDRRAAPRPYWTMISIGLAATALFAFFLIDDLTGG